MTPHIVLLDLSLQNQYRRDKILPLLFAWTPNRCASRNPSQQRDQPPVLRYRALFLEAVDPAPAHSTLSYPLLCSATLSTRTPPSTTPAERDVGEATIGGVVVDEELLVDAVKSMSFLDLWSHAHRQLSQTFSFKQSSSKSSVKDYPRHDDD